MNKVENLTGYSGGTPLSLLHHFKSTRRSPEEIKETREKLNRISAKAFMERHKVDKCEVRDENAKVVATYNWEEVKDAY